MNIYLHFNKDSVNHEFAYAKNEQGRLLPVEPLYMANSIFVVIPCNDEYKSIREITSNLSEITRNFTLWPGEAENRTKRATVLYEDFVVVYLKNRYTGATYCDEYSADIDWHLSPEELTHALMSAVPVSKIKLKTKKVDKTLPTLLV
jgi:hypothetical protein